MVYRVEILYDAGTSLEHWCPLQVKYVSDNSPGLKDDVEAKRWFDNFCETHKELCNTFVLALVVFCINVMILLSNVIYKIIQKYKKHDDSDIDYIMLAKFSEDLKKYYEKNNL